MGVGEETRRSVAGALAGGVTRMVVAPLDTVRIRLQLQSAPIHHSVASSTTYSSVSHAVRCLLKEEGLRTLWRGNFAATILWVMYSAVQFPVYHLAMGDGATPPLRSLFAGAFAGCVATAASYPLDRLRAVLAAQGVPKVYDGTLHATRSMLATGGVASLYKGLTPALAQVAPYVGLSFYLYEEFSKMVGRESRWGTAAAGTGAGLVSKLLMYPLDTIKRRFQVADLRRHARYAAVPDYSSMASAARTIVQQESVRGLYKGVSLSIVKSGLSTGLMFTVFEWARRL